MTDRPIGTKLKTHDRRYTYLARTHGNTAREPTMFTPGPWTFTRALTPSDGGYDYGIGATFGKKKHCIAEVIEVLDYDLRVNARANACLIAAAPDLLAALENISIFYAPLGAATSDSCTQGARAAIAKARGAQATSSYLNKPRRSLEQAVGDNEGKP